MMCIITLEDSKELTKKDNYGCGLSEGYGTAWGEGRSGIEYYIMSAVGATGEGRGSGRMNMYLGGDGRSSGAVVGI